MLRKINDNKVLTPWGDIREMTKLEKEWDTKVKETAKATEGKARILDPFKGWIEK